MSGINDNEEDQASLIRKLLREGLSKCPPDTEHYPTQKELVDLITAYGTVLRHMVISRVA